MAEGENTPNAVNMGSVKKLIGTKVYGIPVVIIAVIGFAVVLYFLNRNSGADTPTDAAATDGTDDLSGDFDSTQPTFSANHPYSIGSTAPGVTTTATEDTNDLWGARALVWLMANGVSYDLASTTISKFLSGKALTVDQKEVRDKAIKQFGLPPEGLDNNAADDDATPPEDDPTEGPPKTPPVNGPDPVIPQKAVKQFTPPGNHVVKGNGDRSASDLAVLYYGRNGDDARDFIRGANQSINWSKPIPIGAHVHILEWRPPKYFLTTTSVHTATDIAAKNGTDAATIRKLNPGMEFPVKAGVRVRIR